MDLRLTIYDDYPNALAMAHGTWHGTWHKEDKEERRTWGQEQEPGDRLRVRLLGMGVDWILPIPVDSILSSAIRPLF